MADHPPQSQTELEGEINPGVGEKDTSTQTSDDKLATDLYKDYSSQNQIAIQVFLALVGAGVGYGVEVRDAYAFFAKNKIDADKLIKDPKYRAQVKKYAGHVNFWEKGAVEKGTSKLGAVLDGANKAIKEVDTTNEKLINLKEGLIKDYSTELQNLYGLEKKEIDAIMQRAKYAVREDPNISMQDFVQGEAQSMARRNIEAEVERDLKAKKETLTPIQEEGAIKVKTAQKKLEFVERTKPTHLIEEVNHSSLISNCKQQLNQILTIAPPASIPPPPTPSPLSSTLRPSGSISRPSLHIPSISLPSGLTNMFGGLGNMFGGLGKGLGSFFGKNGALSKGFDLANKVGKQLINRGLDAIAPGLGFLAGKLNEAIKNIIGIDIEGLIIKGALFLVGAVAAVIVILPIIIGIGVFSSVTGDKPMEITSTNYRDLGWSEFNNQYLTINNKTLSLDFSPLARNDKKISWQQFEKDYLVLQKQLLSSLDPNRHDDVEK